MIPVGALLNIVLSLLQFIFASLNLYSIVLHICLVFMTMPQSFFSDVSPYDARQVEAEDLRGWTRETRQRAQDSQWVS